MKQTVNRAIVTTPAEREIHIERIFDAPRERVWQAMTDPTLLAQWWGRGNRLTVERYEFTKGGHWRFVEHTRPQATTDSKGASARSCRPSASCSPSNGTGCPAT